MIPLDSAWMLISVKRLSNEVLGRKPLLLIKIMTLAAGLEPTTPPILVVPWSATALASLDMVVS